MKITKNTTIGELIQKKPKAVELLLKRGLHCVGCHVAFYETIEQGALAHGLTKKEIDKLIEDVNKLK